MISLLLNGRTADTASTGWVASYCKKDNRWSATAWMSGLLGRKCVTYDLPTDFEAPMAACFGDAFGTPECDRSELDDTTYVRSFKKTNFNVQTEVFTGATCYPFYRSVRMGPHGGISTFFLNASVSAPPSAAFATPSWCPTASSNLTMVLRGPDRLLAPLFTLLTLLGVPS